MAVAQDFKINPTKETAELLASVLGVYNEIHDESFTDGDFIGRLQKVSVIWVAEKWERMCKNCEAYAGRVFTLDKLPNNHPNCRCGLEKATDEEIKNSVPIIDIHLRFGRGLYVTANALGAVVEIGGKRYYDLTDITTDDPTESMAFGITADVWKQIKLEAEITGTINPATQEHLQNEGFAGLMIGDKVYGLGGASNSEIVIGIGAGAYLAVGGEAEINVNLSQLWKFITGQRKW